MLDWIDYRKELMGRIGEIAKLSPETVKAYQMLSSAGQKTDQFDAKTRELIALAVAVTLRCDGCITVHTDAALKHGATREEIAEALGVAISVNAGAALVYSARTMDAVAAYTGA
ncbi:MULTISPECIES: carboxymuconolactone decarboxylase family protein [Paraburkholderia]|uniref:carboxymuconolactone decarboxylase family protein n=1 Tax=Paraburkholderia TaxID=1822464 RepID=UPI00224DE5E0|nr:MULTISPECIES: carboxymuconolactone decarboxylase family protein [Paraburkholderia]MCX4161479.1 carboxymuconolactone decarboxylase family protein [Paraburkholderia megapolitana]MDN7156975.1 carboxymuconolactone decarboxylase family protein [Paraburkholderia sp. CHISQ3]MDQ6494020.1 carboxymuconolactone decarboxylase family protein [Paraburkholderia megapolitana]